MFTIMLENTTHIIQSYSKAPDTKDFRISVLVMYFFIVSISKYCKDYKLIRSTFSLRRGEHRLNNNPSLQQVWSIYNNY